MPALKSLAWKRVGDCIEITSHKGVFGTRNYPKVSANGRQVFLHRLICERRNGPLRSRVARHTCDNPRCIRPDHIIPGTHADNSHDRDERGRAAIGELNGQAKLTENQVRLIREARGSLRSVGARFGISHTQVRKIKTRHWWKHLN